MIVVGGGVIGLELGSVWNRLGAEVTVVEFMPKILGPMDGDISKNFQRILKKQGMAFKLSSKVTGVEKKGKGLAVSVEPAAGGDAEVLEADIVLVAIGRRAYTEGLGLDQAGVVVDDRGRVQIDTHYKTNVDGIYAIGDVVVGPMLAHKAEDEGVAVAEILAGQAGHVNYDVIPGVVYTQPEVASVGKTEEELKAAGVEYKTGKFNFTANGRARAMNATDGFAKVLSDAKTDQVLGVHIVGFGAGEMIHEAAFSWNSAAPRKTSAAPVTRTRPCRKPSRKQPWVPSQSRSTPKASERFEIKKPGRTPGLFCLANLMQ
jgi:dihydrolipoamide dehydrogenase